MLGICNKNNPVPSGENRYIQFSNASWKSYLLKRHFRICYSIVQSHLLFFIFYNLLNTLLFYYKCKLSSFYSCQKNGSFNPFFPCFHPLYHFLTFLSLGHPTILFPSFLKARSSLYTHPIFSVHRLWAHPQTTSIAFLSLNNISHVSLATNVPVLIAPHFSFSWQWEGLFALQGENTSSSLCHAGPRISHMLVAAWAVILSISSPAFSSTI